MSLKDRVVMITGATGGLGGVVTRSIAATGARMVLLGRSEARLKQLSNTLGSPHENNLVMPADLSNKDEITVTLKEILYRYGRLDALIHLVGGWVGGSSVVETSINDVSDMLEQHLWTTLNLVQIVTPHLIKNQWGRVIVISSPFVSQPKENMLPYVVGKAAQETLILTLSEELKGTGVTANILRVKTIDVEHVRGREPTSKNASWTTPEEISSAILYLCSEEAEMINGARIPVYGSY